MSSISTFLDRFGPLQRARDHGDCGEPTRFELSRRLTMKLPVTPRPPRPPTRGDGKTEKSAITQSGLKWAQFRLFWIGLDLYNMLGTMVIVGNQPALSLAVR